jgi:hypothetical protein
LEELNNVLENLLGFFGMGFLWFDGYLIFLRAGLEILVEKRRLIVDLIYIG